jgi:diguanylate cyclase
LVFYFQGIKETPANYWYQFAFGLIPLLGGLSGILKAKQWGWLKSKVGKAVFFIALGGFAWGIGQMFWSLYYNIFQKVEVPYPSLADIGYSLSFPFLALGLINLSKATGAKFSFRHRSGKVLALVITSVAIVAAYYLLIVVARSGVIDFTEGGLKLFFDLAYPIGDLVILLSSLLIYGLSFNYLGGRYKLPILSMIFGLLVLFFGDFSFSYTTTIETYYNGHWVDIVLPTAWMLIVFGVNSFSSQD